MATKTKTKSSSTRKARSTRATSSRRTTTSSRRRRSRQVKENVASRAFQLLLLTLGFMLLLAAVFGGQLGVLIAGLMVFVSAFPPFRRSVDRWLVGKYRGEEADQAAMFRMAGGLVIILIALILLPR